MCQILYKPKEVKLPTRDLLEKTAMFHSDGCGYMVAWKGSVFGRKGLSVGQLIQEIEAHEKVPLVIHFRLRTSGKKGPTATHPFPFPVLGIRELKELTWQAELGVAHNGILDGYGRKKLSDTQEYLLAISTFPDLAKGVVEFNDRALGIFTADQKWALMDGRGEVRLLGKWEKQTGGLYHSAPIWEWGTAWEGYEAMYQGSLEEGWRAREEEDSYGVDEKCKYCKHFSLIPSKIRETCMVCMQQSKFEVKELITGYGKREYQKYLGDHHFVESEEGGSLPGGGFGRGLAGY